MPLNINDFRTPGQLLAALLADRGWTQRVLAIVLDMDETAINRLIANKRPLDADLALFLEELFLVPAEKFLELQKSYDLAKARIEARPDPERANRAALFGGLPVADMIRRGWIKARDVRDVAAVQSELIRFFQVNRLEDIEILPHAAKKTQVSTDVTPAQLAWLYRVKQIASGMLVARYTPGAVASAIEKLKGLLSAAEEARKVPRIMAESGIRFILVEALPSSKIDGVCFWLNEESPVIALSMRFDRIDNFWFVLRHELEHVSRRHGLTTETTMLDTELVGESAGTNEGVTEEERVANEAAADFCVPQKMMDAFVARKAPLFREADIIAFSRMLKVHPGLIAGQIRHRTAKYHLFGSHLVKIRSIVAPNAITDGWGDLAPSVYRKDFSAMSRRKEMQRLLRVYSEETGKQSLDMHTVARWAAGRGWRLPVPPDPLDVLAKQFTEAAREDIEYDKHTGKPYRVYHALRQSHGDTQLHLFINIDNATRDQMLVTLVNRREQMVSDGLQLTYDQDHWNRQNPSAELIQLPMDLTFDIELRQSAPDEDEGGATG